MCGPDDVFRLRHKRGVKQGIQFDAHQYIDLIFVFVLQAADFPAVGLNIHMDVRVHVTGKAKMLKAK